MAKTAKTPKFLGNVHATASVGDSVNKAFIIDCLNRLLQADFGDLDKHDNALNQHAYRVEDGRILAAYTLPKPIESAGPYGERADKIWVITYPYVETCVLFPSEY